MRNEITLTDEEITAAFAALNAGVTIDDITFTRDTLDDFRAARNRWATPGAIRRDADGRMVIDGAQIRRGQPRETVRVIDFGAVRGVVGL